MQTTYSAIIRLDAFCGRANGSLTVFAVVLAIVIAVVACEQRPPKIASLLQPIDPETGISMLSY
jgi:hypothetical protein